MILKAILFVIASTLVNYSFADDKDCDKCNNGAEAAFLVCLKDAKTESAKKECDAKKDKQKNVCKLTACFKKPFS
ncbi:MAG: hypothetical protein WCH60_17160 [Burkholderiales bacterium]